MSQRPLSDQSKRLLAERLSLLMMERNLSGRGLSKASGVALGTVYGLIKGRAEPTLGTLLAIGGAMGLSSIEQMIAPLGTELLYAVESLHLDSLRT